MNNMGFRVGNFEGNVRQSPFSRTPLSFGAPYSHNLTLLETRIIDLHFAAGSMGLSSFNFLVGSVKGFFRKSAFRPFKVNPRSLILVRIESVYATSY